MNIRLALDRNVFNHLIRGKTISFQTEVGPVEVWLQDIGYDIIESDVAKAAAEFRAGK